MKIKRLFLFLAIIGVILLVFSCVGPNEFRNTPDADGLVAGFWSGFWNGLTASFALVASLFTDNIIFYNIHNCGRLYNFGFLVGGIVFTILSFSISYNAMVDSGYGGGYRRY